MSFTFQFGYPFVLFDIYLCCWFIPNIYFGVLRAQYHMLNKAARAVFTLNLLTFLI